ncbi:MAG: S16 family serine protease [Candidatus Hadarchaeales archaeon]
MPRKLSHQRFRRKRRYGMFHLVVALIVGMLTGVLATYGFMKISLTPEEKESSIKTNLTGWIENARAATIPIVAVGSTDQGEFGVVCTLAVKIEPGDGYVYVGIDPTLVGFDFQDADRTAIKVAAKLAGYQLDADGVGLAGYDVKFIVVGPGERVRVEAIDGPSAGAATTIALLSVLENRKIKSGYAITGTIQEDGSIGPVGGVFHKAAAAAENGARVFLVPKGQSKVTVYERVVEQIFPGFSWVSYRPKIIDLNEYFAGYGLSVVEVSTIEEAASLMLE